ncbi:ABC transporter transmembrane domain-containing protein [Algoriphagus litoralis]|uniref:ABC transporter transmembrane domain-containing protein n=1 Tax=Algoriphagus litoralis TaxID=2202829 RepID=UPI000DB93308|nr:ABC transporter transmembrane domain-containing protein [Algoriphagus litoralis]
MNWFSNKTLRLHWFGKDLKVGLWLALGWLASLSTFFLSLMIGWFYDLKFQEGISKSELLKRFGLNIQRIDLFFLFMGIIILLKFSLQFAERIGINRSADLFIHRLASRLYRKQINWQPEVFEGRPFGKYLLRYSGDMTAVRNMLIQGIHRGLRDGLFLITGLGLLLWINSTWTLWLSALALLALPLFLYLDQKQLETIPEKRNSKNELLNYVTTSFSKHRIISEKGNSEYNFRGFRRRNKRVLAAANQYQKWESIRHALINVTGPVLIAFLLGILYFSNQVTTAGELLTFLLVLAALVPAFRNVIKAPNLIQKGLISLLKIEKLIRKNGEPQLPVNSAGRIPAIPISRRTAEL